MAKKDNKTERIFIRCTEETKMKLQQYADENNTKVSKILSEYIAEVIKDIELKKIIP